MNKHLTFGIVGASGLVGRTMLQVLLERMPQVNIRLFASARSAGTPVALNNGRSFTIEELHENTFEGLDLALFSAGSVVSEQFAPIAVLCDCVVIDNSSFWRMNEKVPLVVPEVNAYELENHRGIIANPNCSTIQLVVVLDALRKVGLLRRVLVSTYQSISGGGQKLLDRFHSQGEDTIHNNIMFHSAFDANGHTTEEAKMHAETRKILDIPELPIDATCVRIPVEVSHCEAVNVEFHAKRDLNQIVEILSNTEGIVYVGGDTGYPTPQMASGRDEVFVGRVRADNSNSKAVNFWIVADNLRKGAATNAVQIAEYLVSNNLLFNKKVRTGPIKI